MIQIKWENRLIDYSRERCTVSVDGTDFRILEPRPFNKCWFSHKFKGPGVRYEVAVSIKEGWIVWVRGPFACGKWPDICIVMQDNVGLEHQLLPGEYYVADNGYNSAFSSAVTPRNVAPEDKPMHQRIRGRHESCNKRFKQWRILSNPFRPNVEKHFMVFKMVANITQLILQHEEPLFEL